MCEINAAKAVIAKLEEEIVTAKAEGIAEGTRRVLLFAGEQRGRKGCELYGQLCDEFSNGKPVLNHDDLFPLVKVDEQYAKAVVSVHLARDLIRLLLPNRRHGCMCDACLRDEIRTARASDG